VSVDVAIVGGGVIGLSTAWRLLRAGHRVAVFDDPQRPAATKVAAGMLTPITEAWWGEDALLGLGVESMARWPSFADELEQASGVDFGLRLDGVLAVGFDSDDARTLDDLHALHDQRELASRRLRSSECRVLDPLLAPAIRAGLFAPDEGAVDPRRLTHALTRALHAEGGIVPVSEQVDPESLDADVVVLAAGAWSPAPVRPVFGEVLRLRQEDARFVPSHVIRGIVRGRHVYVVPRLPWDGPGQEIIVGATSLERGFNLQVTAGGVRELLDDAFELLPSLSEAHLTDAVAGLRPGTPDNAPIVGWAPDGRTFLATGHYRNGVLLAPLTADAVTTAVAGERLDVVARACDPARFQREPVA
jgi:glycine oxidase